MEKEREKTDKEREDEEYLLMAQEDAWAEAYDKGYRRGREEAFAWMVQKWMSEGEAFADLARRMKMEEETIQELEKGLPGKALEKRMGEYEISQVYLEMKYIKVDNIHDYYWRWERRRVLQKLVQYALKEGKTVEQIAEELEEPESVIRVLIRRVMEEKSEEDERSV